MCYTVNCIVVFILFVLGYKKDKKNCIVVGFLLVYFRMALRMYDLESSREHYTDEGWNYLVLMTSNICTCFMSVFINQFNSIRCHKFITLVMFIVLYLNMCLAVSIDVTNVLMVVAIVIVFGLTFSAIFIIVFKSARLTDLYQSQL